jgi:ornithine carbamoyltransferase
MHTAPMPSVSILASARKLQRAGEGAPMATLLGGRHLALLCEREDDEEARLFSHAATLLGARVTQVRPSLSQLDTAGDGALTKTARMLGRLYDGIECQGLDPCSVRRLARDAGVPVFDGLASPRHATAPLVQLLGGAGSVEEKRCLIVQAVLLDCLLNRNPPSALVSRKISA